MPRFSPDDPLIRDIATVLLAGDWASEGMAARLTQALHLPRRQKWIDSLTARVIGCFKAHQPPPRHAVLARFLTHEPNFRRALGRLENRLRRSSVGGDPDEGTSLVDLSDLPPPQMAPAPKIAGADQLPALRTPGALACWLGVSPSQLDWFADCDGRLRRLPQGRFQHYRCRWIDKSAGRHRLIESPKPRLQQIQHRILKEILEGVPAHPAAHAFRRGRSTLTCAGPHVARRVVLRIDLRDFFPTIRSSRIHALFHALGYPERVARLLTGLCTNSVGDDVLPPQDLNGRRHALHQTFGQPHLPQGAPTSPALANLCAYRLDCRLAGLARAAGANYTRYADDLVFSGDCRFERSLAQFRIFVGAIVLSEGFTIRHRKTRVMRSGRQQSVAGLLVNRRLNVPRADYDRLKAKLHNCRRFGPESQNLADEPRFREQLQGQIAYVRMVHAVRGAKLQALFDLIHWN